MNKSILAATIMGLSMGGALAQTTGPAGQDTTKMGTEQGRTTDGMKKDGMSGTSHDSMNKDGMKKGTTGNSSMQSPANGNAGKSGGEGGSGR